MQQNQTELEIQTPGQGLVEVTREISAWVQACGISDGLLTVFCRHTSASLTVQENADPDVVRDLEDYFKQLVTEDNALYRHSSEGVDDMPAHIKSSITDVSLSIPVSQGRLALGTWQGIFLFEHRHRAHRRRLALHILGD